ncbi:MAG: hypothetical protein IKH01_03050 [Prevotella sp.]|nr:hypothetical protein [Prevotella sp.]
MEKFAVMILCLLLTQAVNAQEKKFSPEQFDAQMEEYITMKANLDQQEAAKLFPLFKEMHKKQRSVYSRMRALGNTKPANEAGCAEAIKERDKCNLELKQIEQQYHQKMLQVVPASKLYDIIKAETHFYRKMMKGWQKPNPNGKPKDKRR